MSLNACVGGGGVRVVWGGLGVVKMGGVATSIHATFIKSGQMHDAYTKTRFNDTFNQNTVIYFYAVGFVGSCLYLRGYYATGNDILVLFSTTVPLMRMRVNRYLFIKCTINYQLI